MQKIVFIFLFVLFSGCATFVETRVSAFHNLELPLAGLTFTFVETKQQEGSLEFQSYAKLVKAELEKRGMIDAPFEQAKYAIFMFYGIDDGKQVVSSYPIFGQTGVSNSYTTGTLTSSGNTAIYSGTTVNTPTYGLVGSGTIANTVFTRYLNIEIIDIAKSGNGKIQKVYEGNAISSGSERQLAPVIPAIVQSIFEDFPGKSGVSRTSQIPVTKLER